MAGWGLVSAAPHEHLVVARNGKVIHSAQGGSVWAWPFDSVAKVDMAVRRLQFTADQVTREKTGVSVTGLAVYRVVEPLIAWRMLDLTEPKRVEEILREMFVGATRRLVANLSLEDCLTRRKDALAVELAAEVTPVVQGSGAPEDSTHCGWGLAIDTIEIQDVRVLSKEVFERLQAEYRGKLALDSVRAQAEVARAEAAQAEEVARRSETHRQQMFALEQARIDAERQRRREQAAHEAELAQVALAATLERKAAEAKAARAEAEAAAEGAVRVAEQEAAAVRVRAAAEAERVRMERAALGDLSEARLREVMLTQTVPEAARALKGMVGEIQVRPGDLTWLAEAIGPVVAAIRQSG